MEKRGYGWRRLHNEELVKWRSGIMVGEGYITRSFTDTYSSPNVVRDSIVGVPTCYGSDGPGIEFQWWRDFPHPSRPGLGLIQLPIK